MPLIATGGDVLDKPLLGYTDLVVSQEDGTCKVVDFETASRRHTDSKIDSDLQSIGYAYAASASPSN